MMSDNIGKNNSKMKDLITFVFFLALFFLIYPQKTYAYLDPGTGSYIIQIIIASLLGGVYLLKVYWRKIKNFFVGLLSEHTKKGKDEKNST